MFASKRRKTRKKKPTAGGKCSGRARMGSLESETETRAAKGGNGGKREAETKEENKWRAAARRVNGRKVEGRKRVGTVLHGIDRPGHKRARSLPTLNYKCNGFFLPAVSRRMDYLHAYLGGRGGRGDAPTRTYDRKEANTWIRSVRGSCEAFEPLCSCYRGSCRFGDSCRCTACTNLG